MRRHLTSERFTRMQGQCAELKPGHPINRLENIAEDFLDSASAARIVGVAGEC